METRYLTRTDGRIAYDIQGNGPLVVGVPGMGELRSTYRFVVPALIEAGCRVATMDLRGHGDSDATFRSYDDEAAGSDVLALIDELGGPAVIIGNSMGAGAAAWAAAERPRSVSGLILIGPFVRNPKLGVIKPLLFRLAMLRPWAAAVWHAYLPSLYPGRRPSDFEQHRARIRDSMRRPGHAAAFTATTHTSHAPVEARLSRIESPAMVIMGDRDPDFADPGAEAAWVAGRLHADIRMVPNAGHYPHVEFPELVNPAITAFMCRVLDGKPGRTAAPPAVPASSAHR